MARPLRIEFAGAFYHVTTRGNAREAIYLDDSDRKLFLELLANGCRRYHWRCHAYCLMDNHYHLLIETPEANLSKGMKYLNATYTQAFNRQHKRIGHIYQGRFKAILVEHDEYLTELARYIALNPVRAGMVRSAKDWPWSSYRATAGLSASPPCLLTDFVLSSSGKDRKMAQQAYRQFVSDGRGQPSPWEELKNQVFLGSDTFIEHAQCQISPEQSLSDIPTLQKLQPKRPLASFIDADSEAYIAMAKAYLSGHYTLAAVGQAFGVSYATVSRAVKRYECQM